MTSPECRQRCLDFERRFHTAIDGSPFASSRLICGVDLLQVFDALRDKPEQLALYLQAMREMRAEKKARTAPAS